MKCKHPKTRNLYDQRPPSEGRKLKAVRRLCESCGTVLPFSVEAERGP